MRLSTGSVRNRIIEKDVLTLKSVATGIRITLVTIEATALGLMMLCSAQGIETAGADTRILTALSYTGTIRWTVLVNDTLGSTTRWSSEHAWQAGAFGAIVDIATLGIRTTWIGQARIDDFTSCKRKARTS